MPATHVSHGRWDVDDENLLVAVHVNPSTSVCRIASHSCTRATDRVQQQSAILPLHTA
jgi:hypothetical protein